MVVVLSLSQRSARSPLVVAILQFVNAQFLKSNCQNKICELVGFKPEELDLYSLSVFEVPVCRDDSRCFQDSELSQSYASKVCECAQVWRSSNQGGFEPEGVFPTHQHKSSTVLELKKAAQVLRMYVSFAQKLVFPNTQVFSKIQGYSWSSNCRGKVQIFSWNLDKQDLRMYARFAN